MDPAALPPRPSGIPRLSSRLPVPRSTNTTSTTSTAAATSVTANAKTVRPAQSRESLKQSSRTSITSPRLRAPPSRDNLSASFGRLQAASATTTGPRSVSSTIHNRVISGGPTIQTRNVARKPSQDTLFRKSSSSILRDQAVMDDEPQTEQHDALAGLNEALESSAHLPRKSRPSLSERTVETLRSVPASPAIKKRNSSFFQGESPSRSDFGSRPGSSYQDDGSMRPPSSSGPRVPNFRASTNSSRAIDIMGDRTPVRRQVSAQTLRTPSGAAASRGMVPPSPTTRGDGMLPPAKSASQTLASRPLKPRASLNGLYRKPSMPTIGQDEELGKDIPAAKREAPQLSDKPTRSPAALKPKSVGLGSAPAVDGEATARKSSSALRDQIAKAKAAKRDAANVATNGPQINQDEAPVIPADTFDFGLSDDPFNERANLDSAKEVLRKRINMGRTSGRLNIAALGLKDFPEEVINMYHLDAFGGGGSWAEAVDLKSLGAADNEFTSIDDKVFPDVDPRAAAYDDDAPQCQFAGIEILDLHGNLLTVLPLGLRRLELLTTLNLSNNKLGNGCFEIISRISSLRDLKLAGSSLSGTLEHSITKLKNLECLEVQRNALTALPRDIAELANLRILNVAENALASLPFGSLSRLPLSELLAAKNKLSGTLIHEDIDGLSQLKILDVTGNSLAEMTPHTLNLPSLTQLSCSFNRMTNLPDMSSWQSLLALSAEDNCITTIPDGMVMLARLRSIDFTGNNITVLDDRIGVMDELVTLRLGGNPLRERKYISMATDDLKRALKARLEPVEDQNEDGASEDEFFDSRSRHGSMRSQAPTSEWIVKTGGVVDRSGSNLSSLDSDLLAQAAATGAIKILQLHHNSFQSIPNIITSVSTTITTLNLAYNEIGSERLMEANMELPSLKELILSGNRLTLIEPLMTGLKAPELEKLDVSFNRLTSLIPLRPYFPKLTSLLVSNNSIADLTVDAARGLRVLDCSSNEIGSLNARLGLLTGPNGLQRLDVSGNRFRVPKYTVLEKGTEATLSWLRGRIPEDELDPDDVD